MPLPCLTAARPGWRANRSLRWEPPRKRPCSPSSTSSWRSLVRWRSGVAGTSARAQYVVHYLNRSDQVSTISATRAYSLGGVEFSPADAFSPNTMDRWTGLIFSNRETTVLGLPHTHGDKWAVIDGAVMIAQNCGSCGYQGMPLVSILGATKPVLWNQSGWVIVEAADAGGRGLAAWAAVRPAWGRVGSSQPGYPQLHQLRPTLGGAVRSGHLAGGGARPRIRAGYVRLGGSLC